MIRQVGQTEEIDAIPLWGSFANASAMTGEWAIDEVLDLQNRIAFNLDTPAFVGSYHDVVAALIFCQPSAVDYSFINGKKVIDQG